jgi:hypothetical protein
MICDICKERSNSIIRFNSWQVCQWCVSNNVLERALAVESNIAKLREAVATANTTHQRNIGKGKVAEATLEHAYAAYADLTTAMNELATSTTLSKMSQRLTLANAALHEYKHEEQRKTALARHHG